MSSRALTAALAAALAAGPVAGCSHPAAPPAAPTPPPAPADPTGPHAQDIAAQVQPYLDGEIVDNLVVGVVDNGKLEIYGFGHLDASHPAAPDGRTIFELGSITQVFTSLLLADAVARGEVAYDTAVSTLVPMGVTIPSGPGRAVTLDDLATHRAGLPSLPPSLAARQFDPAPYAGYDANQLYRDLTGGQLLAPPGAVVQYSTWGAGILGFVLARKDGGVYRDVVAKRVLEPLGLKDTFVAVPAADKARVAPGHDEDLAPVPALDYGVLDGAGGMHSTARDLLELLRAEVAAAHGGKGPLAGALRDTQAVRVRLEPRSEGMGWWIEADGRRWHNGSTTGNHAFVGFDPNLQQGVVILSGTSSSLVDRLGGSILDVLAGKHPTPVTFPAPSAFAPLVGHYKVGNADVHIVAKGKRLYLVEGKERPTRLEPLSATEYFLEDVQAPVVFHVAGDKADALLILVGGQKVTGTRIED